MDCDDEKSTERDYFVEHNAYRHNNFMMNKRAMFRENYDRSKYYSEEEIKQLLDYYGSYTDEEIVQLCEDYERNRTDREGKCDPILRDKEENVSTRKSEKSLDSIEEEGSSFNSKFLQELTLLEPSETMKRLVEGMDEIEAFLNEKEMTDENILLLLKVLVGCKDKTGQKKFKIFTLMLRSKFFSYHLFNYFSTILIEKSDRNNFLEIVEYSNVIFNELLGMFPSLAAEKLSSCMIQCLGVASELKERGDVDIDESVLSRLKDLDAKRKVTVRDGIDISSGIVEEIDSIEDPPNNFRTIPIVPKLEELLADKKPFIRENITNGKYESLDHYLDVQFRLLRADFLQPLREGLKEYLESTEGRQGRKYENIRVYTDVRILGSNFTRNGILHDVHFRANNVNWETSKRLMFGSLLCLSNDNFDTVLFATVAGRKVEELRIGRFQIRIEESLTVKILNTRSKYVMIESEAFFEAYSHVLRGLKDFHDNSMPLQRYFVNAETEVNPPAYLVRYRRNETDLSEEEVEDLQTFLDDYCGQSYPFTSPIVYNNVTLERGVSFYKHGCYIIQVEYRERDLPVKGSLLCLSSDNFKTTYFATVVDVKWNGFLLVKFQETVPDLLPTFVMIERSREKTALRKERCYEEAFACVIAWISRFLQNPSSENVKSKYINFVASPFVHSEWPSKEKLGFDDSQYEALKSALTKELCIIQGPPGTGKTFIGLKVVKILLDNRSNWGHSPIVVVCYTNHALDQFLKGMIEFTHRIVRIGGRCDESLKGYNLSHHRSGRWAMWRRTTDRHRNNWNDEFDDFDYYDDMEDDYYDDNYDKHRFLQNQRRRLKDLALQAMLLQESIKLAYAGIISDAWLQRNLESPVLSDLLSSFGKHWKTLPSSKLAAWLRLTSVDYILPEIPGFSRKFENDEENGYDLVDIEMWVDVKNQRPAAMQEKRDNLIKIDNVIAAENEMRMVGDYEQQQSDVFDEVERKRSLVENQIISYDGRNIELELQNEITGGFRSMRRNKRSKKIESQIREKTRKCLTTLQKELSETSVISEDSFVGVDLWRIPIDARWKLYRFWLRRFVEECEKGLRDLEDEYERQIQAEKSVGQKIDLDILRSVDIVGLTTTGAAKNRELLQSLGAKIVIAEEAAEVLEAHLVTTLTQDTEHLILIGDHQQLRPKPTVYELAKNYNLEISFFERMIKNGFPYVTLREQHRMRPEISSLLVPHIYRELENHPSVYEYESIRGMKTNLFFISHSENENDVGDATSHSNEFEAQYLVNLCQHLLLQGYEGEQITILSAYAGQMFLLQNKMPKNVFEGVRVTVVDNYQGEENDIILLSMVRSNEEGSIGFLKTANRVCVALSRAKKGLYCVGHFELFAEKNALWKKLVDMLKTKNMIGPALPLVCQVHQDDTLIENPYDFVRRSIKGGCTKECSFKLACGHTCKSVCHANDRTHETYICREPCSKILCGLNHLCPALCSEDCGYKCLFPVTKTLQCGHDVDVPCSEYLGSFKCPKVVEIIANCGHKVQMPCSELVQQFKCPVIVNRVLPCYHSLDMECHLNVKLAKCQINCVARLKCGHQCRETCHTTAGEIHRETVCKKNCERIICQNNHPCPLKCFESCQPCEVLLEKELPCSHKANLMCSEDPASFKSCSMLCEKILQCSHHCPRECGEPCGGCGVIVDKRNPVCGHSYTMPCGSKPEETACRNTCQKSLPCGHGCKRKCYQKCEEKCKTLIEHDLMCGHHQKIPCFKKDLPPILQVFDCKEPCNEVLKCGHRCKGTCGECRQGRIHVSCREKCEKSLLCGHSCGGSCSTICPPCNRSCENSCIHSHCERKCGIPCVPCREPCTWKCPHQTCTKECWEYCNRDTCNEPCEKLLICEHPCMGFCGEKCPKICRICKKDEFDQLAGDPRFLVLPDCGHECEVRVLDELMTDGGEVVMKRCPQCKTPIRNCTRYRNAIRRCMNDISKVTTMIVEDKFHKMERFYEIEKSIANLEKRPELKDDVKKIKRVLKLDNLKLIVSSQTVTSIRNQITFLTIIADLNLKGSSKLKKHKETYATDLDHLKTQIMKHANKITRDVTAQICRELNRMELLFHFYMIEDRLPNLLSEAVQRQHQLIKEVLMDLNVPLNKEWSKKIQEAIGKFPRFKNLAVYVHCKNIAVSVTGFNAGTFFKGPNGQISVAKGAERPTEKKK